MNFSNRFFNSSIFHINLGSNNERSKNLKEFLDLSLLLSFINSNINPQPIFVTTYR